MVRNISCMFVIAAVLIVFAGGAGAAGVEMFTPEGTVKDVRQVTARFTDQMVAFGDPRTGDPFDVKCPEKGKGRWIDGKVWSYDFEQNLPAGVACTFTLRQNLKTLTGVTLTGRKRFAFDTGGPSVLDAEPYEGSTYIEEQQTFLFWLDAAVDDASVMKNVYCSIEGVRERVGIRIISGEERKKFFAGTGISTKNKNALLFQCRQVFPPKAHVKIVWGKGVKSKSGMATAKDQVLAYRARGPFTARFSCMKERPQGGCIPLSPMRLSFSAPIPVNDAKAVVVKTEKNTAWKARTDRYEGNYVEYVTFEGPFPEKSPLTVHMPKDLKDISGRPLSNANKFPLAVRTDAYPALAKFSDKFGVIEAKEGALLPVTVRNIEEEIKTWLVRENEGKGSKEDTGAGRKDPVSQTVKGGVQKIDRDSDEAVIEWLYKVDGTPRERSVFAGTRKGESFSIAKPAASKEFEVIGIPLKDYGFYVVEIESRMLGGRLLGKPQPMYVPTAALVTNMAAHLKWGRASSLVFVTDLAGGEPVSKASVTVRDCKGGVVWQGMTDDDGIARINKQLPDPGKLPRCSRGKQEKGLYYEYSQVLSNIMGGLFVFARKGKDMTFTHSGWDEGIESWRFNLPERYDGRGDNFIAHTVFDRTLLRAGETIHMKHFLRQRTMEGLFVPSNLKDVTEVAIEHVGSTEKYTFPVSWKNNGTAESSWKIPTGAKLGTYNVYFKKRTAVAGPRSEVRGYSGSFRVEEFRVPLMRAFLRGPKEPAINPGSIDVDVDLRFLSGGGAAGYPVKIRAEVERRLVSFAEFEEFNFDAGRVKTGIERSDEGRDRTDREDVSDEGESEENSGGIEGRNRSGQRKIRLKTVELNLDKNGTARAVLRGLPKIDSPHEIAGELEFRDPNGEVQTSSTRIPLYPAMLHVGLSSGTGEYARDNLKYQVIVVDLKGKPLPGAQVKVKVFQRSTYSHRRRITGGFYAFEHITETKEAGEHCNGRTGTDGILYCEGKAPATGRIVIQAEVADEMNNIAGTYREVTVYGNEDTWFEARNDDRIDLIPEKRSVESGEKMRFQVRMPFKAATALITVEREGVMDAYVRKVTREDPVIDVPVKTNYVPNVFVSALLVRGRVADTRPSATFDPGKPAYKLGIAEVRVGWKPHALNVKVDTDKKVYAVRETVRAHIKVRTGDGAVPSKGGEVTVAVVDEGLLELKPNTSWALLEGMMRRKGYEVATSTSQMMVVGKRHFGRKALPHGGGGGKQLTRELFDTLVYWKGVVALDGNGEADVAFGLNDSLTSFKVVAIANAEEGLFGTGDTSVRTTQDLMVLAGLPSLVREGDRFTAEFTVRNTSQHEMKVVSKLALTEGASKRVLDPLSFVVPPGEAREACWPVIVPQGVEKMVYEASVEEAGGNARDVVKFTQKVIPAVRLRAFQATLVQLKDAMRMDVERPYDAEAGRGGINVVFRPKISEGLSGVSDYMRQYPYVCLEQKTSKAVALRDREMWRNVMAQLPAYLDGDGLAKYFPLMLRGNDVLTSYLLSISNEAGYEIPQELRTKMIKGLKGFVEGRIVRYSSLQTADLSIRKMAAIEALSRYREATPQLLTTVDIEPKLWPTSAVLDWINVLRRMTNISERDRKLKEAEQILRARLNLQGTTMGLSTERSDYLWWLMVSADLNAARTLMASMEFDKWREDVPRIVRGLAGRMKKGHWDTTTANAWGVLAMEKFSRKYESIPVSGVSAVSLAQKKSLTRWSDTPHGEAVMFPWPPKKDALRIVHQGGGTPWVTVQSLAAIPLKAPFSSGYRIKKTITPVEQKVKNVWTRGDVMRVRLEIDAQSDMTWVVVTDPIPSGSIILGSGLGRDSALLSKEGRQKGWAWEAYRERSFEALRVYYEFVPKGVFSLEYTVRFNNDGTFHMPETRVEALYAPESFGEAPNAKMEIKK